MTMDYTPVHRPQRTRISESLEPPLPRIHRLPLLRRRAGERPNFWESNLTVIKRIAI